MNKQRQAKLDHALKQIAVLLIKEYEPEKIILFGSMAQETIGEWSDLDLVIIKATSKPFLQRLKEVALLCQSPVAVDFLVYTPDEFAYMIADKNPFVLDEIIRKGQVIYERKPVTAVA
jgi:predicted nucleotidyltransferase